MKPRNEIALFLWHFMIWTLISLHLFFHPPYFSSLFLFISFSLSFYPLSWVWTWGWAKSPERIEETDKGKNRKKRKITLMSLTLLLLSLLLMSLFSPCLSVWMKSFEGEKRSWYWLALWKMQPAQPDPNEAHCERTSHLYHTGKSITPSLVQAGSEFSMEGLRRKTRRRRKRRRRVRKVSTSSAEDGEVMSRMTKWVIDRLT